MPDFDITVPHISRVYDYWLGGKDNFAADRELGEQTRQAYPNIVDSVRANRAFLSRSVRFLTEAGIRQFLDIGAGLPTADNIHEVAQREAPDCRIVYADNDPVVLTHARALLRSTPLGSLAYLDADLRYPDMILAEAVEDAGFQAAGRDHAADGPAVRAGRRRLRGRRAAEGGLPAGKLPGHLAPGQRHRGRSP